MTLSKIIQGISALVTSQLQTGQQRDPALPFFRGIASFRRRTLGLVILGVTSTLLVACASPPRAPLHSVMSMALSEKVHVGEDHRFWWAARFKMVWPEDSVPDGAVDLFLAHAVIEPVLRDHSGDLLRWRFHRRAAPDATGHQFTFLFYADPQTASELFHKVKNNDLLVQAISARMVEKVILDVPEKPSRPHIEDTSDPRWSPSLQRNWPSFIMGVSALWLGLIDDEMVQLTPFAPMNITDRLEAYRKAETRITKVWNQEGQHAFLHHLSAVFGYEPLRIRKEILF